MLKPAIAVFTAHPDLLPAAQTLAQQLQLPFAAEQETLYDYLLILTPNYLGLQKMGSASHPLYINFLSAKMHYRQQQTSLRKEALARACGLKGNSNPKIIDATAGLARDSYILAHLGFQVTLLERSPIIHALIADGIKRAGNDAAVLRLHLLQTDAVSWLKNCKMADRPDLIYLDPMFPERKKSALAKLDMRIFHDIVGEDLDADNLLSVALTCANQRVVVKRPRLAPSLAGPAPSFSLKGSSSRFDVYIL